MKRNYIVKQVFILVIITFFTSSVFAQFGTLGQVLATGEDDAEKIFEAYLTPYANGIGSGLSAGWYNTAKSHKLGGFDITVSFNLSIIPTASQSYDAAELGLGDPANGLTVDVAPGSSPTAAGSKENGQQVTYYQDILGTDVQIAQLNLPGGTGFAYTPVPMAQIGIGLVKETDLVVRYSPTIEWGNGSKIGLWGVGLKHSIKQWIPALSKLPVFDMSLQGGYTKLSSINDLNFQASFYDDFADIVVDNESLYSGQEMILDVSNITANLLVSGDFKVICIYGGVGISSSASSLKLSGYYPFPEVQGTQVIVSDETALINPIDISIKSTDGSGTKPRFNAGLRFKFAVVTLNFDYTYANYSIASAGLGISFR
ncbi:MAG: hypothetical protein KOO66_09915 [Bacteroidales bacterium]|nr:hypothetical protein [Bacteroidales bacterium]